MSKRAASLLPRQRRERDVESRTNSQSTNNDAHRQATPPFKPCCNKLNARRITPANAHPGSARTKSNYPLTRSKHICKRCRKQLKEISLVSGKISEILKIAIASAKPKPSCTALVNQFLCFTYAATMKVNIITVAENQVLRAAIRQRLISNRT